MDRQCSVSKMEMVPGLIELMVQGSGQTHIQLKRIYQETGIMGNWFKFYK